MKENTFIIPAQWMAVVVIIGIGLLLYFKDNPFKKWIMLNKKLTVVLVILLVVLFSFLNINKDLEKNSLTYKEELYSINTLNGSEFSEKWGNLLIGMEDLINKDDNSKKDNSKTDKEFEMMLLVLDGDKNIEQYRISYFDRTRKEYTKINVNQSKEEVFFTKHDIKGTQPPGSSFSVDTAMKILDGLNLNSYLSEFNEDGDLTVLVHRNIYHGEVSGAQPDKLWLIQGNKIITDSSLIDTEAEVLVITIQNSKGNDIKDAKIIWIRE